MGRQKGIGRYGSGKRQPDSKPGAQDSKHVASRNDTAVDNRCADILIGLGYPHLTDAPPESAIDESVIFESVPETPAQPGSRRKLREEADESKAAWTRENTLKKDALSRARASEKRETAAKATAKANLEKRKVVEGELGEAKQRVVDLQGDGRRPIPDFKPEPRAEGSGAGQRPWPLWYVQLILEQLTNGTPPEAIPLNIYSQARGTTHCQPDDEIEVPSASYCQKLRTVLRIVTETVAAYRLAHAEDWDQLFTDGTGHLQNLLIAITDGDGALAPLIHYLRAGARAFQVESEGRARRRSVEVRHSAGESVLDRCHGRQCAGPFLIYGY